MRPCWTGLKIPTYLGFTRHDSRDLARIVTGRS